MSDRLRSQRGTTLAEVLVAMALMAVLAALAVALVRPTISIYRRTRIREDAQVIAQAVLDQLRGELMDAQGFLCLAAAGEDPEQVFENAGQETQANALFFASSSGTVVLLDAGAVAETALRAPDSAGPSAGPIALGTLHRREFLRDEAGQWQTGQPGAREAWSCVELLSAQFYGGSTIALHFSVGHCDEIPQEGGKSILRVQTLMAEVSVLYGEQVVAQHEAVLPLPKEPQLWQAEEGNPLP